MIKSLALFAIAAFGVASEEFPKGLTLPDVYGEVDHVEVMQPWYKRSRTRQNRSDNYFAHRTTEECDFALEVYIIQDNTESFQDDFLEMKTVQLPKLVETMSTEHPGTTFGLMSFRDKPIWSLGQPRSNDYCQRFESPLSDDASLLTEVYNRLVAVGGGDPSENQFGAIVAASESETPGWSDPDAVKLIVMVTDAPPHFEGDGLNNYGMTKFNGHFDEANAAAQCLAEYYPTPEQVKNALEHREAYLATIVYDGEWWAGLPSRSWQWFNAYIGQRDEFVEPLGNGSTGFFEGISKVIKKIQDIECAPEPTDEPATAETTYVPSRATDAVTPVGTVAPTLGVTTTGPCPPCGEEPCAVCNKGVVININAGFNPNNFEVKNGGQGFSA